MTKAVQGIILVDIFEETNEKKKQKQIKVSSGIGFIQTKNLLLARCDKTYEYFSEEAHIK